MKTIELKAGEIKPNPFKKYINNGKLDEERIERMEESIAHKTLPLIFSVRQINGVNQLSSGHHRLEAIKRKKGKDFKLRLNVVDFDDETMLIDLIRENLTHRGTDFRDLEDSVVLARTWLQTNSSSVKRFDNRYKGAGGFKKLAGSNPKGDSNRSIQKFLSKQGKTISHQTIKNYLDIYDKLDPRIHNAVGTTERLKNEQKENKIGVKLASKLASIEKKNQFPLYEQIKKSKLNSSILSMKLVAFKKADESIKNKIVEGKENIENIDLLKNIDSWSKEKRGHVLMNNREALIELRQRLASFSKKTRELNIILFKVVKKNILQRAGIPEVKKIDLFLSELNAQHLVLGKLLKKTREDIRRIEKNVLR